MGRAALGLLAASSRSPTARSAGGVRFPCRRRRSPGAGPFALRSAGSPKEGLLSRLHAPGPSVPCKAAFLGPCSAGGKHRRLTEEPRTAARTASSPPRADAPVRSFSGVNGLQDASVRPDSDPARSPKAANGAWWRHTWPFEGFPQSGFRGGWGSRRPPPTPRLPHGVPGILPALPTRPRRHAAPSGVSLVRGVPSPHCWNLASRSHPAPRTWPTAECPLVPGATVAAP